MTVLTNDRPQPQDHQPVMLSDEDRNYLACYEQKLQIVRDCTASVVHRYTNGFFLHGPGGSSKSYTVAQTLREMHASYRVSNSRLTGRGLFDILQRYPDSIHVIEDAEQMLHDQNAVGVLRSALWGLCRDGDRGVQERWVTWSAHRAHAEILFTGGVIVISNRPLLDQPELHALKTRIPCLHLQPGDNELRALMRKISIEGFQHDSLAMSAPESVNVCEFLITESLTLHRPLDMRLLINAYCAYLQWREGHAGVHWQDTVAAHLRERPTGFRHPVQLGSRADRMKREREIAREIALLTEDRSQRLRLWEERTGKSQSAFYRRLAELGDV